ncbi:MAG: glycogen debranching N-terminal domain-containing protein [Limnochordales bacterium]
MTTFSHVMKRDEYFFVADEAGEAGGGIGDAYGLFFGDTRVLSRYRVGIRPGTLSATTVSFRAGHGGRVVLLADGVTSLHGQRREVVVERRPVLADGMFDRIEVANFGAEACRLELLIELGADFRDMFEVRGMVRPARGVAAATVSENSVLFRYCGLDGLEYITQVSFSPAPAAWERLESRDGEEAVRAVFTLDVEPRSRRTVDVMIRASIGDGPAQPAPPLSRVDAPRSYEEAQAASEGAKRRWLAGAARWRTDNAVVNEVLEQSLSDVFMLLNDFGYGLMPSAGVPWYAVPFGRDSLITSMQLLGVRPDVAAATLRTLARWQGARLVPELDEEPGKILHELRRGEMARTGEIPFRPYYGTVDATALFVIAAGEYWRWTADRALLEELMPAVRRAVAWLDAAEAAGGGYIRYHRTLAGGLTNQGWKDSGDAIVHRDGRLAEPPIALAEVQGYAYAARLHYAALLEVIGDAAAAAEQRRRAEALKAAFNRDFWVEETQYYAMALDGAGAPVASVSSNPGQCLWTGIVAPERAEAVRRVLMGSGLFSGYGVRTLSAEERGYHPLSYHRGTVWPHDNSLIALGLARYGFGADAARIACGLFTAATFNRDRRLPELFGGYPADVDGPAWYPVACIPQAWAAGTPFMLLQAVMGLEVNAPEGRLRLAPVLPEGIDGITVDNLIVGDRRLRIEVKRRPDGRTEQDEVDVDVRVLEGPPLSVEIGRAPLAPLI